MKKWIDYLFEPEPVKTDKPEQKPEEPKPAAAPEKKPEVKAEQPEPKPEETKTEQAQTTRKHSGSFINCPFYIVLRQACCFCSVNSRS